MSNDVYRAPRSNLNPPEWFNSQPLSILRWILLIPAVPMVWLFTFAIGGTVLLDNVHIEANEHHPIYILLGGVSALTVMFTGLILAPSYKFITVSVIYAIGAVLASLIILVHLPDRSFSPFFYCAVYAIVVGGIALFSIKAAMRA